MRNDPKAVTMNVSLPRALKRHVDEKVSSGGYGSASELVREALREKLQRDADRASATDRIDRKLLEALRSDKSVLYTPGYFKAKKREFLRRQSARRKSA